MCMETPSYCSEKNKLKDSGKQFLLNQQISSTLLKDFHSAVFLRNHYKFLQLISQKWNN